MDQLPGQVVNDAESVPANVHPAVPVLIPVTRPDDAVTLLVHPLPQCLLPGVVLGDSPIGVAVLEHSLVVHAAVPARPLRGPVAVFD